MPGAARCGRTETVPIYDRSSRNTPLGDPISVVDVVVLLVDVVGTADVDVVEALGFLSDGKQISRRWISVTNRFCSNWLSIS
jgi:hypothetical protein